jgi:small subunit ribosomal protein S17
LREAKRDQELMNEEEKNGQAAAEEPQAEEPAEETAEREAQGPQAADEPEAAEADAQAAGADEQAEAESAEALAPMAEAEPEEELTPKQRRKLERSRHTGEPRPQRSATERAAERAEARARKGAGRRRVRARARARLEPGQGTPPAERRPGSKKVRQGMVVSSRADKTITVEIEVVRRHPVYEKIVRRSATIHAHDEGNEANAGDLVRVIESRPMSRTKRWRLVEILERAR